MDKTYDVDQMPKKNPLSLQIDLSKFEKATDEEKKQADVMSESTSFFKDGMRKLRKNPLAMFSIIVLVLIILMITTIIPPAKTASQLCMNVPSIYPHINITRTEHILIMVLIVLVLKSFIL